MLDTGDILTDFTLEGVDEHGEINTYTLSELTDDSVAVLNVYVYDYSPVCTNQVCDISELEWLSINDGVNVVGISGDGPYAHQRFIEDNNIGYPLLCDTSEEIMEELGVIHEEKDGLRRVPQRSMFLIDEDRRIRWKWVADDNWDEWNSGPIEALSDEISQLRS
jgi:peroxiredoxin